MIWEYLGLAGISLLTLDKAIQLVKAVNNRNGINGISSSSQVIQILSEIRTILQKLSIDISISLDRQSRMQEDVSEIKGR